LFGIFFGIFLIFFLEFFFLGIFLIFFRIFWILFGRLEFYFFQVFFKKDPYFKISLSLCDFALLLDTGAIIFSWDGKGLEPEFSGLAKSGPKKNELLILNRILIEKYNTVQLGDGNCYKK